MKRIYVAGPISLGGSSTSDEINARLQAFRDAAAILRSLGHVVENPADNQACKCASWADWMRLGISQLLRCDAMALLPEWELSRGARVERDLAEGLGYDVRPLGEWLLDEPAEVTA